MLMLAILLLLFGEFDQSTVPIELPLTHKSIPLDPDSIIVTIDRHGTIFVGDGTALSDDAVRHKLQETARTKPETRVYVRVDRHASGERIIDVMKLVHGAGLDRVALLDGRQ